MKMMKAAVRHKYGSPQTLLIKDMPVPAIKADEILVKVKATTVNRSDCGILTGKPLLIRLFTGFFSPRRIVTGTDFSGIVVKRGDRVTDFNIGEDVYGFFDEGLSSHAEYLSISVKKAILPKPGRLSYEQAAASLEGAHYAFYFLNKVPLFNGIKVLVNGGTGAIGNAAIQFLKHKGATVTATCETSYIPVVKSCGADAVIDYTSQDFTSLKDRFDFIFDAVGKSTFGKCRHLLTEKGIYISSELGPNCQNPLLALVSPFVKGKKVKFPFPFSIKKSMAYIHEMIETENFTPLIDRTYPFEQISEAFKYVMSGQKKGNVVLAIT